MRGSGVDVAASDSRADGGGCNGHFSRVEKCSCLLAITDALSDSSEPSVDISGADVVLHFCLSLWNLPNASLILLLNR